MFNATNITMPVFNMSYPYGIESIINVTRDNNVGQLFVLTNIEVNYLPIRLLMLGLLLVYYTVGLAMWPNRNKFAILSASSIVIGASVGILQYANMFPEGYLDIMVYIILAGVGWMLSRRD